MKILMINNSNILQGKLLLFLNSFGEVDIISFFRINIPEIEKQKYDLIVLSGSAFKNLTGNEKLYKNEMDLIRKTSTPVIGICFGLEIIAETFKEKLFRKKIIDRGLRSILYADKKYSVWHNHFFILKKLSRNSRIESLCESDEGIQILKVKNKNIFGIQFHPEHVDNRNDGRKAFEQILRTIY